VATGPAAIDAVIVAYNSRATLRGGVEPLAEMPDVSVVVVDNASPEDPLPAVAELPVTMVRAPRNGGFSYGCNLGALEGDAPYILLLNPDARIDAGSLGAMRAVLERDPAVGVVGPRILDDDGALLYSRRRYPRLRSTLAQALFLHRIFRTAAWSDEVVRDRGAYEQPGDVEWLSGACLLVRRSAFDQIGGLDEGFFLYCEDTDLCRRLADGGWAVRYEPGATARHEEGSSAPRHGLEAVHASSRVRYARKHSRRSAALVEVIMIALHEFTHAVVNMPSWPKARGHARALRAVVAPSTISVGA
jgi:N-acetylglucosaminyl-diphospho-decaprenol L-rhamnosyltransferase